MVKVGSPTFVLTGGGLVMHVVVKAAQGQWWRCKIDSEASMVVYR